MHLMVSRNFIPNACIFNVGGFLQWGNSGWGAPDSCSQVTSFAQYCLVHLIERPLILEPNHYRPIITKQKCDIGHHKICRRPHLLHGVNSYWLLCEGTLHLQNLVSEHSNQPKEKSKEGLKKLNNADSGTSALYVEYAVYSQVCCTRHGHQLLQLEKPCGWFWVRIYFPVA